MSNSHEYHEIVIGAIRGNKPWIGILGKFSENYLANFLRKDGIWLWENQGLFRLISRAQLQNAQIRLETARRQQAYYPRLENQEALVRIYWEAGIPISAGAAKCLLSAPSEESKDSGEADTATDTPGEDQAKNPELDS